MKFDRHFVDRIKAAAPIVDVIGASVELRRSGKAFIGNCPFHDDSKRKLSVSPDRGSYRCWVCDAKGDAIQWLQARHNLTFPDAVTKLAREHGIPLPE